jgi:hypothetical protein
LFTAWKFAQEAKIPGNSSTEETEDAQRKENWGCKAAPGIVADREDSDG